MKDDLQRKQKTKCW